jgi:valyl-tRNA synthetase
MDPDEFRPPARDLSAPLTVAPGAESEADRWIVSRANDVTEHATRLLEDFQLGEAVRTIRDFLWGEFCDWYLEIAKIELRNAASQQERDAVRTNLLWVFEHTLRLLHPMMPFVTEELWQQIARSRMVGGNLPPSIMIAPWPSGAGPRYPEAEARMESVFELVRGVRNARAEYKVDAGRWVPATIVSADVDFYRSVAPLIGELPATRLRPVDVAGATASPPEQAVTIVASTASLYLPLAGLMDVATERARLEKERGDVAGEVERAQALLAKPGFVEKAPEQVVSREREKIAALQDRLAKLDERLGSLGG